ATRPWPRPSCSMLAAHCHKTRTRRGISPVRAIGLGPQIVHSRFGDGPDGRRQIGSTPAGGGVGNAGAPRASLKPRPACRRDEGLDRVLGEEHRSIGERKPAERCTVFYYCSLRARRQQAKRRVLLVAVAVGKRGA